MLITLELCWSLCTLTNDFSEKGHYMWCLFINHIVQCLHLYNDEDTLFSGNHFVSVCAVKIVGCTIKYILQELINCPSWTLFDLFNLFDLNVLFWGNWVCILVPVVRNLLKQVIITYKNKTEEHDGYAESY